MFGPANVVFWMVQLPDEFIARLEDSGVKYIPYGPVCLCFVRSGY